MIFFIMNVSIFYINSVKVQIAFFCGLREYLGSGAKKTALQQATYQTTYLCWSRNSSHFLHLLAQQICLPIFLSHAPLSPLCSHARDRPPARATPVSITDHLPPIRRAQDHLRGALMRPPALPPPSIWRSAAGPAPPRPATSSIAARIWRSQRQLCRPLSMPPVVFGSAPRQLPTRRPDLP
jgi:hypothetical protein